MLRFSAVYCCCVCNIFHFFFLSGGGLCGGQVLDIITYKKGIKNAEDQVLMLLYHCITTNITTKDSNTGNSAYTYITEPNNIYYT